MGTDTPAPGFGGDHGVLQPRVNQAIPQHVDETHQLGAFPGDYPAQAVEVDKLDLVPFRFLEHPGIEGFGVQRVNLLIGESAPPFVHRRHVVNLAPGGGAVITAGEPVSASGVSVGARSWKVAVHGRTAPSREGRSHALVQLGWIRTTAARAANADSQYGAEVQSDRV